MTASAALLALLLAAAGVAGSIERRLPSENASFTLEDSLGRLMGTAKEGLGDMLFLQADIYFHGGAAGRYAETREEHAKEGLIAHAETGGDWIQRVYRKVHSHAHYHLAGRQKQELLPFFALATRLDPHNIEAVLTTAYWLEAHFGKPDEAAGVLQKGRRDNPVSWEVSFALGSLYFKHKQDHEASVLYFREAVLKSEGLEIERYHRVDMHYFLAESLWRLGRPAEALPHYRRAVSFYGPDESPVLKKILLGRIAECRVAGSSAGDVPA